MTDRYERIRAALAMGPTPGEWYWSDAYPTQDGRKTWSLIGDGGFGILSCDGEENSPQSVNPAAAELIVACDPDTIQALLDECDALRAEVSELRAARIAYASEFPEAKDGGPDTGNIHTNIRSLKARAERLAEALQGWWEAHRPDGWTEDQHRSCPHVNLTTDAEKTLATALLRDQEGVLSND